MARQDKVSRALGDLLGEQAEPETSETQTEPSGPSEYPFATGTIKSVGVGLRAGELALLESMAASWGVGRNFVTRWLVICGLRQYLDGTLSEPPRKLP